MSDRTLRAVTAVLALLGIAVAGYLLYARQTGATLACTTGACETVQSSRYAEIFGVPVAAMGLAGYVTMLVAAIVRGELARLTHATVALSALVFSAYLLVVQIQVIGAVCQWCIASDALTAGLAATALLRLHPSAIKRRPARA